MTTLESYKREATKIFYLSVDRDIDLWQGGGYYYSGAYKNIYFQIDPDINELKLYDKSIMSGEIISRSSFFKNPLSIFTHYKTRRYIRKLKKHFKKVEQDKKEQRKIDFFKEKLESINQIFIKEIRKEKINSINSFL